MTLEEAIRRIRGCAERMDALYRKVVFDEWAIVFLVQQKARLLSYFGPRKDDFQRNFAADMRDLSAN